MNSLDANIQKKIDLKIPLGVGELGEFVKFRKRRVKEVADAHKRKEFPIHYSRENNPVNNNEQNFLTYALSLIRKEQPLFWSILMLRMQGFSNKRLAKFLSKELKGNITVAAVSKKEAEAINYVKAKIDHLRKTGIPLFNDPSGNKPSILAVA